MNKYSRLEKVLEIKSRSKISSFGGLQLLQFKLDILKSEFDELILDNTLEFDNILFFFPVRIVAFIQTFFRNMISIIIESDEKYLNRANSIKSKITFDYETVKALYGKKITIGDLISHSISLNNIDSIYSTMKNLLDVDFKKEISNVSVASYMPKNTKLKKRTKIIKNINKLSAILQQTFDLRHQVCHEESNNISIQRTFIEKSFDSTLQLFKTSLIVAGDNVFPDTPHTFQEMEVRSQSKVQNAGKMLNRCTLRLKKKLTEGEFEEFAKGHKHWLEHLNSWSKILTIGGGTLHRVISNLNKVDLIEDRIQEIEVLCEQMDAGSRKKQVQMVYK